MGRYLALILLLLLCCLPLKAHANLLRSEPSPNARLSNSPDIIRLYFSEPVETRFSQIEIRNTRGVRLDLPSAQVDSIDAKQLSLDIPLLPDGLYTVLWRVVSQTDGHPTSGNFPIIIGVSNESLIPSAQAIEQSIPLFSSLVRWLNFLSLACLGGTIGFVLFVLLPSELGSYAPLVSSLRMSLVLSLSFSLMGALLLAVLQAQILTGADWNASLSALPTVLLETRFGQLWLVRIGLSLLFGLTLLKVQHFDNSKLVGFLALVVLGLLLTQSLFSHASGAEDSSAAVLADWMHLCAMALWFGGLIQLLITIRLLGTATQVIAYVVAHFSNLARLALAMLILTGLYAAWLQVGSLEGFITTAYGQALTVKLLLFLPLLVLGAINRFVTQAQLKAGAQIWSKRLRYLVGIEISLMLGIFAAVAVMTAIAPARLVLASRAPLVIPAAQQAFFEMRFESDLMVHLTINPATVGENQFIVDVIDLDTGLGLEDVSLIRLRIEDERQQFGESEIRPEREWAGHYITTGANLSAEGDWRVRLMMQRPNEFDTVLDFNVPVKIAPAPQINFDLGFTLQSRALALFGLGFTGIFLCLNFIWVYRPLELKPELILLILFLVGSLLFIQAGVALLVTV